MRMEITNSLPPAFAATADLEMDAPPLQTAQKITEHFSDTTDTAHLLLKQEAEHTTLTHVTTLEKYIAKHRGIRTGMRLANYPNSRNGESVTIQLIKQGLSAHPKYRHLQDTWIETGTVPDTIHSLAQRLQAVHARTMELQTQPGNIPHGIPQPATNPTPAEAYRRRTRGRNRGRG